jgi:exonuclease SbcD
VILTICGDAHIGAIYGLGGSNGRGGNTRVDDYERTLNKIVDHAIKVGSDAFIQTGDIFDVRNPAPEHVAVVNRALKRLSMAGVTSIVIMGNHDYIRSGETFKSSISSLAARNYPNVRTVLEPQVMTLANTKGDGVDLLLIPFRDRRMYPGKTTQEDSDYFDAHMEKLIESCSGARPIVAVGHNFFYEGSYNDFGGTEILSHPDTYRKCDLVAMGHYHHFRKIRKESPIAFYTGSMEKLNFGDEKDDKFFFDYDTRKKKVKVHKCPSRPLYDSFSDLSMVEVDEFKKELEKEVKSLDIEGKIVRFKVAVRDTVLQIIKKTEIEKMLYAQGAFYVSRVNIEPVVKRIVRDDKILKQKDDFSMMKAFIESQKLEDELSKTILREAKEIMEHTNVAD